MSRTKKVRSNNEFSESTKKNNPDTAHYTIKTGIKKAVQIIPRNIHQEEYLEYLLNPEKMIVIAQGPAGTGKTVMAMLAAIKAFSEKKVNKIILCRPSVGTDDENLGFLPGDINEKLAPWLQALFDVLLEYFSAKELATMIENKRIECLPLMYVRGRNISSFVILDESQNCSKKQILALGTRLCEGSKLVLTGDNDQSDKRSGDNGLKYFSESLKKYGRSEFVASIEFSENDIERHPVVKEVIDIFRKGEE